MEFKKIREKNLVKVRKFKSDVEIPLPLLDTSNLKKSKEEIISRALVLFIVVSVSYGYKKEHAIAWLSKENLYESLSLEESQYLEGNSSLTDEDYNAKVEGMYAFAWILGLRANLDFNKLCDNLLRTAYPDLLINQSSAYFRGQLKLREAKEVVEYCDLAYCLHWMLREYGINNDKAYVIIERRRVLEWVLGDEEWDDVSLDT